MKITTTKPAQYTPGPYYVQRFRDGCDESLEIRSLDADQLITSFCFWAVDDFDPTRANEIEATARLLASAPALVSALAGLLSSLERLPSKSVSRGLANAMATARSVLEQAEWQP